MSLIGVDVDVVVVVDLDGDGECARRSLDEEEGGSEPETSKVTPGESPAG